MKSKKRLHEEVEEDDGSTSVEMVEGREMLATSLQDWMHFYCESESVLLSSDENVMNRLVVIDELLKKLYLNVSDRHEKNKTVQVVGETLLPYLQLPLPYNIAHKKVKTLKKYEALRMLISHCPAMYQQVDEIILYTYAAIGVDGVYVDDVIGEYFIKDGSAYKKKYMGIWPQVTEKYIEPALRRELTLNMWRNVGTPFDGEIVTQFKNGELSGQSSGPVERITLDHLIFNPPACLMASRYDDDDAFYDNTEAIYSRRCTLIMTDMDVYRVTTCLFDWKDLLSYFKEDSLWKVSTIGRIVHAFNCKMVCEFNCMRVLRYLDEVTYSLNFTDTMLKQAYCLTLDGGKCMVPRGHMLFKSPGACESSKVVDNIDYRIPAGYVLRESEVLLDLQDEALEVNHDGCRYDPKYLNSYYDCTNHAFLPSDHESLIQVFKNLLKVCKLQTSLPQSEEYNVELLNAVPRPASDSEKHAEFPLPRSRDFCAMTRLFIGDMIRYLTSLCDEDLIRSLLQPCLETLSPVVRRHNVYYFSSILRNCRHVRVLAWMFYTAGSEVYQMIHPLVSQFHDRVLQILIHEHFYPSLTLDWSQEKIESLTNHYYPLLWFLGMVPSTSEPVNQFIAKLPPTSFSKTNGMIPMPSLSDLLNKLRYATSVDRLRQDYEATSNKSLLTFSLQEKVENERVILLNSVNNNYYTFLSVLLGDEDFLVRDSVTLCSSGMDVEVQYNARVDFMSRLNLNYPTLDSWIAGIDDYQSSDLRLGAAFRMVFELAKVDDGSDVKSTLIRLYEELYPQLLKFQHRQPFMKHSLRKVFEFLEEVIAESALRLYFIHLMVRSVYTEGPFTQLPAGITLLDCKSSKNTSASYDAYWYTVSSDNYGANRENGMSNDKTALTNLIEKSLLTRLLAIDSESIERSRHFKRLVVVVRGKNVEENNAMKLSIQQWIREFLSTLYEQYKEKKMEKRLQDGETKESLVGRIMDSYVPIVMVVSDNKYDEGVCALRKRLQSYGTRKIRSLKLAAKAIKDANEESDEEDC